jgi:eukaryotic-like serine/threonine-protein kinase
MALNPGQQLLNGKYTIERKLGRGQFTITYLAKRNDGERWAIKILNPDVLVTLSEEECKRLEDLFWLEALKLAKCGGIPHIIRVDTLFREGNIACLPMEYMEISLADRAKLKLPEAEALEYVCQIGEALTLVHQQQLVHCDIRPKNIFRQKDNKLILADFRLTRDFNTEHSRKKIKPDGFSPIELYLGGKMGAYTDVYSLAATLYELLTGEEPASAIDRKQNGQKLISPQVKNPEISATTTRAILEGMELMPEKRPQSVQAWLEKLKVSTKIPEVSATNNTPSDTSKKSFNWQTFWMAAAPIITLLVGIPTWLTWMKQDSSSTPATKPSVQVSPNK